MYTLSQCREPDSAPVGDRVVLWCLLVDLALGETADDYG